MIYSFVCSIQRSLGLQKLKARPHIIVALNNLDNCICTSYRIQLVRKLKIGKTHKEKKFQFEFTTL